MKRAMPGIVGADYGRRPLLVTHLRIGRDRFWADGSRSLERRVVSNVHPQSGTTDEVGATSPFQSS
jgi:hypothetical protein